MDDRSLTLGQTHTFSLDDVNLDIAEGLFGVRLNLVARMCVGKLFCQPDMSQIFLIGIGNVRLVKCVRQSQLSRMLCELLL